MGSGADPTLNMANELQFDVAILGSGMAGSIMAAVLVNFFLAPETRTEAFVGTGFIASGAVAYLLFVRGRGAQPVADAPGSPGNPA